MYKLADTTHKQTQQKHKLKNADRQTVSSPPRPRPVIIQKSRDKRRSQNRGSES